MMFIVITNPIVTGDQEDRNTVLSSIPEEQEGEDISLVDQFYKVEKD